MRISNIRYPCLSEIFIKNEYDLTQKQVEQFSRYLELILNSQKMYNLTGFKNPVDIINNLFIDSLKGFNKFSFPPHVNILDIGTGAGIPSIPIKIVFPYYNMVLIESSKNKSVFLSKVIDRISIRKLKLISDRAENIAHNEVFREKFDIVIARAVAPLKILLELSLPFLKINGFLLAYKGIKAIEEIKNAHNALKKLGGEIKEIPWYTNKETKKNLSIVVVKKIYPTPAKYPRKPGIPQKRPL